MPNATNNSPTDAANQGLTPSFVFQLLVEHRRTWLTSMLAVAFLAGVVALVMPRQWKATQGVLIRPEAAGLGSERLGKFADLSEMKTIQETLLELARSKNVVTSTLKKVGPAKSSRTTNWPTAQDVVDFRDSMVMTPPGGAEFGMTEIFYLGVRDTNPQRAAALVTALSESLELRTKEIRQKQANSMIAELQQGVSGAETMLKDKINHLAQYEGKVGASLSDMRSLVSPLGGSSEISQDSLAIRNEIRQNETLHQRNVKLLDLLQQAKDDPKQFIATPNILLASQPALARLKQGLVDSRLATARLLGRFSASHPLVIAAQESEKHVQQQLYNELGTATQGIEMELALSQNRQESLKAQLDAKQESQRYLASHRAVYSQLVAAAESQTTLVDAARTRLADAQVHQAGAMSSSLLSRIDEVESGLRPIGPGRSTMVAVGGLLGLLGGLGGIFWRHGPAPLTPANLDSQANEPVASSQPMPFGFPTTRPSPSNLSPANLSQSLAMAHPNSSVSS